MKQDKLKVLVHGATGAQASPLIDKLRKANYIPYALTRNRQHAYTLHLDKSQVIEIDINDEQGIRKATEGMDIVMLTVPFFANDNAGRYAIQGAKEAGVQLIIWNTSGEIPNQTSGNHGLNIRMYNMEYLMASGVPYIVFQPAIYLENLLPAETSKRIAEHHVIEYPTPAQTQRNWMSADDMANYMVAAINRPDLAGLVLTVSGEPLNGNQLAQYFSRALGREIGYRQISSEQYAERLNKILGEGSGKAIVGSKETNLKVEIRKATFAPFPTVHVLEKINIPMESIEQWVRKNAHHFS